MNTNPDEIEQVETTITPTPIGLPKAMQMLSQQQLAATLREWREKPKEQPDESA